MSVSKSNSGLSVRGQKHVSDGASALEFEVLWNLWHPQDKPDGWVSLGLAENDVMHSKMTAFIEKNFSVPSSLLTYHDGGAGSRRLINAVAKFLTRHLKPAIPFEQDQIIVTNGCSSAIDGLSYTLGDPGDGFLLGRPYYRTFISDVEARPQSKIIPVSFGLTDPMSLDAVRYYEATIQKCRSQNQPIKALILCHPHNPLGRCYPREVLIEYMKLCQRHQIHLISDEIYALSTWTNTLDTVPPPIPFISISSIPTTDLISPHLVHLLWGMSKDFGANGIRIGITISQSNSALISALQTLSLYTYPSNIADNITATILEDTTFTDDHITENRALLSTRHAQATNFLRSHSIACLPGANAAFFIVADLGSAYRRHRPHLRVDEDVVVELTKRLVAKKVFILDSTAIGCEEPGWYRIVFSQYEEYLMEGLRRIVEVVEHVDGDGDNVDASVDGERVVEERADRSVEKPTHDSVETETNGLPT